MNFTIDPHQLAKIKKWADEQDAIVIERQRNDPNIPGVIKDAGLPYYGAIGGAITYCFSPTGLGTVLTVQHAGTNTEINVTDFDSW